jgi:cation transport ATPase
LKFVPWGLKICVDSQLFFASSVGLDRRLGPASSIEVEGLTPDDLEMNLDFVALVLFRNELKHDSRAAIQALKEGEVCFCALSTSTKRKEEHQTGTNFL